MPQIFVMFLTSQLSGEMTERMEQPQPGQENYGFVNSRRESDIMEKTLAGLAMETSRNSYATYPMGFYKGVTLNETELAEVKSITRNRSCIMGSSIADTSMVYTFPLTPSKSPETVPRNRISPWLSTGVGVCLGHYFSKSAGRF